MGNGQEETAQTGRDSPGTRALRRGRVSNTGQYYLVTAVTVNRLPLFITLHNGRLVVQTLRELHATSAIDSLAFVVMPDHVHWMFRLGELMSLSEVVRHFKGRSARRINEAQMMSGVVWQPGFHDHGIRDEKSLRQLARYIVANPLRAGLVQNIGDYPLWDAAWLESGDPV